MFKLFTEKIKSATSYSIHMIENYRFGKISINGKTYTNDVLIFEDEIREWWREKGHTLQVQDLEWILNKDPEILIIGTGSLGVLKVPTKVKDHLESQGIELNAKQTEKACELYNTLRDKKKVGAGLHLTC